MDNLTVAQQQEALLKYNRQKSWHQRQIEFMLSKIREIGNLSPIPDKPTIAPPNMILAQAKLVFEETMELLEACGIRVELTTRGINESTSGGWLNRYDFLLTFANPVDGIYLPSVAKEIADVSVVTIGMFSEFGISDTQILNLVDENNIGKLNGGYLDSNRKWRKPPNYQPPNIYQALIDQGWNPEGIDEKTEDQISVSNRSKECKGQEETTSCRS